MIPTTEFEKLLKSVLIKTYKTGNEEYKNIVDDIKNLSKTMNAYNNQKINRNCYLNEIRFLKGKYKEQLKESVISYQSVVFEGFTYKNDVNTMINGASSLKLWLIRYLALKHTNIELTDVLDFSNNDYSITEKYQVIDVMLFKKIINEKVTN